MNSKQRRKTYRHLRRIMRDKTPVMVNKWGKRFTSRVFAAFRCEGTATVMEPNRYGEDRPRNVAAHRIKPIPRCYRFS